MRTIVALCSFLVTLPAAAQLRSELKMPPPPVPPEPEAAAAPRPGATVRLGLRDAVERALQVDPQTLTAVVNRQRSELAVLRAQLDRFSLKVDVNLTEEWQAVNFLPTNAISNPLTGEAYGVSKGFVGQFGAAANLRVPIFAGHKVSASISRARNLRDAAALTEKATARSVALAMLQSYWAVRRVELQRVVSEQALGRYEEAVAVVGSRVRAGLAPPVDVNRIETRRQRERARLAGLEGTAREGRAQLAVALGYGGAELELTEGAEVPAPPAGPGEVDRLLRAAMDARPELRAARRQTLAADDQVKVARSTYWPTLTAVASLSYGNGSGSYGYLYSQFSGSWSANPFKDMGGAAFLGATLSINLFDTFNTKTQVRDAEYQVALQRQEERRLGRLVEADVRTAHARLQRLYASREPLAKTRDLAKDTLDIIERRYRNGEALILDYLDAQFELLNSEIDLADSAAAIAQTWGELWAATGRIPGAPGGKP
ncbi:MAG: TolC family protein [Deltaproteobacteria bacterium]|nr:TolC family protein [Deltaproteobacteria bacterium]